ncbi:HAD-IA family hydrolase [Microvirga rosea]|nr:HAD-IA family hydrolase [Microvirga rosea]MCB8823514.1 HAD-IA family hydrolase [Microvirga rosea]
MVDVDGVLVRGRPADGRHWSASLETDLGLRPEDLHREFFAKHWNDVVIGRAKLEDRLLAALRHIAPHVTVERLIEYWFAHDACLDRRLLQDLQALRSWGYQVYLATNQEHRRAQYLMGTLGLASVVDGIQYSAQIGAKKPSAAFFEGAASAVGLLPADILLIDDTLENVRTAQACGWQGVLWSGKESLFDVLKGQLPGRAIPLQNSTGS